MKKEINNKLIKQIVLVLVLVLFCNVTFAANGNERRDFNKIEELYLKEDYTQVINKVDRYLRHYRSTRNKKKVLQYKEKAQRKLANEDTIQNIVYTEEPKEQVLKQEVSYSDYTNVKPSFYIVQVGAFKTYKNAKKIAYSLKRKRFDSVLLKVRKGKEIFYKVRAGKFRQLSNAQNLVRQLNRKGYTAEIINEE